MYRGKVFCEAIIYLHSKPSESKEQFANRLNMTKTFRSTTIKVTDIHVLNTDYDERHNENVTSITVLAEVLVKWDKRITHLNDYRVRACTELRRQLPGSGAGAIMAHSIDTYTPYRLQGFV